MKITNKILSTLLIIFMLFIFVGCSTNNQEELNNVEQNETINEENTTDTTEEKVEEVTEKKELPSLQNKLENAETISVEYPITVETLGGEYVIEKEPQTIVSVGPNITEAIFAISAGDKLVGRTSFCDYPAEVESVQVIGTLQEPNIELIVELQPDIVIASTHFSEEAANKLNGLGIQTIVLYDEESFDGVYKIISSLGSITNHLGEANAVVEYMQETVTYINEAITKKSSTPSVYYVVGFGEYGDWTATGETFINGLIELAGGSNIAKDATGWAYNVESLVEQDPEIVILPQYSYDSFITTEPYANLSAVKSEKVYKIDENLIVRQGPRLAEGLLEFAKIIQPDAFEQ